MALLLFFFLFFFKFLSSLFFICSLAATSIIGNEECPSTVWVAASPGAYRRLDRGQTTINATRFNIYNKCTYTVWAAAVPGGGRSLDSGQTWAYDVNDTEPGRIWPRTGCNFDGAGRGQCQTGDCGGVLQCQGYGTGQPNTLAEYTLNLSGKDFFDISLVNGFNVPMEFSPTSGGCSRGITCTGDINGQCPNQLKAPGGCNNPCTVFKTDQYCCTSLNCGPTNFSRFFKAQCPDAYSYPLDNANSTFTCPAGTNYRVVFCP